MDRQSKKGESSKSRAAPGQQKDRPLTLDQLLDMALDMEEEVKRRRAAAEKESANDGKFI